MNSNDMLSYVLVAIEGVLEKINKLLDTPAPMFVGCKHRCNAAHDKCSNVTMQVHTSGSLVPSQGVITAKWISEWSVVHT